MVYPQLFVSDEDQQNALRKAQQGEAAAGVGLGMQHQEQQQQQSLFGNPAATASQLMQQLQQAQASLNQQAAGVGVGPNGGNNPAASLMQAQLSQQLGQFGQLGPNFGGGMGGNFGGNFSNNFGQFGGLSLFDMQRAEVLAAMANSQMNANPQAALLQSRFGLSMGSGGAMNQDALLSSLGGFNPLGHQLEGDMAKKFGMGDASNEMLKKSLGGMTFAFDDGRRRPDLKTRRKAKTFPVKLMQGLIENPNEEAVAWLPDGKSFVIVNADLFCELILKKTFKECKYASFVRKLHRWGFVRLTSGTGTDCFHHPLFQQNRIDLCARISCAPRDSAKASETEKRVAAATSMANDRPPSLAGVERFFRSKPLSTATSATHADPASKKEGENADKKTAKVEEKSKEKSKENEEEEEKEDDKEEEEDKVDGNEGEVKEAAV